MWPFAKGSVQPMRAPCAVLKPKSVSAPQLTFSPPPLEHSRLTVFPQDHCLLSPQRCQDRLLTKDQIEVLKKLSAEQAVQHLAGCLPKDISGDQATTLATLLYTTYRWAEQNNLDQEKITVLLTLYLLTFKYVMESPWRTQSQTYIFFRESILRCSVQHSPKSERLLRADECKDSLIQFCRTFLTVLPLIRLTLLPNYRLKMIWETPREQLIQSHIL